jgi:lysophospholipase L1-like esterase
MEPPVASRPLRSGDFALAGAIVVLAAAISPIGIRLATGRLDLNPRVLIVSLVFDAFLLVLAAAVLSRGRIQILLFYVLFLTSPLVLLAALEVAAIGVHLADRIAPVEDLSTLANTNWPPYFMSAGRKVAKDGLQLYQPWRNDDIVINDLGLRTAPPTRKAPGEWRVAITGGSVTFGWRLRDVDTIPVKVQQLLRGRGLSKVTVYNFGIDSLVLAEEAEVLKRFRDIYGIDQVVFLTGANDVTTSYMGVVAPPGGVAGLAAGVSEFELLKAAGRLKALMSAPSADLPSGLDNLVADLARGNSLHDGLITADALCRASALDCDFVLQPALLLRKTPVGPEIRLARTIRQAYPRYENAFRTMYRTAKSAGLQVHDSTDVFDGSAEPYFIDAVHLNEAGSRLLAERVAAIIAAGFRAPTLDAGNHH